MMVRILLGTLALLFLAHPGVHGQGTTVIFPPLSSGSENEPPLSGIGAVIADQTGQTVIREVLRGSGAETAGLLPGDIILSVNGTDVAGLELNAVVNLIRGKADTTVLLRVGRGAAQPFEVIATRHPVKVAP